MLRCEFRNMQQSARVDSKMKAVLSDMLCSPDSVSKLFQGEYSVPESRIKRRFVWFRNNQTYILPIHFRQLIFRDSLLECEQMLDGNPVCFIQNLSPSVLACGFGSEEYQIVCRELKIMIGLTVRKYEVRFFVLLSNYLCLETQMVCGEYT